MVDLLQRPGDRTVKTEATLVKNFVLVRGLTCGDKNSSGDEIANVNFFYDDIAHVLQNTKNKTYFV